MSAFTQLLKSGSTHLTVSEDNPYAAHIVIEPLDRGFGDTLGNALRRVLLSSMPGCAVVEVYIDNIVHEYTAIEGVKEDVTDILLNLKNVSIALHGKDEATFTVNKKGPGLLTAGDIQAGHDGEIINPDYVVAHLVDKNAEINMSLRVQRGRGYQPVEIGQGGTDTVDDEGESSIIGGLKIDATFSPVLKVAYEVQSTRVAKRTDLDKLTLHIETKNGSITPEQALIEAAGILIDQFSVFADPNRKVDSSSSDAAVGADVDPGAVVSMLQARIDQLTMSNRSINRLNSANIYRVSELVKMTEIDLLKSTGIGMKIINEIKAALAEHGLTLDMQVSSDIKTNSL
ncbi:MAG: DNA-directed RNA polymerase subunit alpha [Candidatus Porifericomitaceae bacterium WSBS_2022_MAG_OTU9]